MLGSRTLLVNPPRIDGVAFTRTGRCQEREDVLGTTKPPYSLVVIAALLRERGLHVRLVDQTAARLDTGDLAARLERDDFRPTLIVFCSTIPTLDADVRQMALLKRHFGAPLFCFGPHASCAPLESMERAPAVDGMAVGEPEEAVVALAGLASLDQAETIPSLVLRRGDVILQHRTVGRYAGFPQMPYPAWDLLDLQAYRLPLVGKPYAMVETSRGCPYACDFCVAPIQQGHTFRERDAKTLVDELERGRRDLGVEFFYLWGDTVTLNRRSLGRFCEELIARDLRVRWFANARADNLVDPGFVHLLQRAGCWMVSLGIESESDDRREDMLKNLTRRHIRLALDNLREAGIRSFAFFIFGYPGDTPQSIERTARYAVELDPDFANFYPAVPYPGTGLHEKCVRLGLLADNDWTKMEYSHYLLAGNGLDEQTVMDAISRARRRFFLRPAYALRHPGDIRRLLMTKPRVVRRVVADMVRRLPSSSTPAVPAFPQPASHEIRK